MGRPSAAWNRRRPRLDSAVADWAKGAGATAVVLDIVKGNIRAQRAYARAGFQLTGHEKPGGRAGLIEVEMRKNLG